MVGMVMCLHNGIGTCSEKYFSRFYLYLVTCVANVSPPLFTPPQVRAEAKVEATCQKLNEALWNATRRIPGECMRVDIAEKRSVFPNYWLPRLCQYLFVLCNPWITALVWFLGSVNNPVIVSFSPKAG